MAEESDGDMIIAEDDRETKKWKMDPRPTIGKNKYQPFVKPGYKRCYPENSSSNEFTVYVGSVHKDQKIGNKNPLLLSKIFKGIKGISERRWVNANKIALVFKQATAANDFLTDKCLAANNLTEKRSKGIELGLRALRPNRGNHKNKP